MRNIVVSLCPLSEVIIYRSATAGVWPLSAERKIEVSAEQRLKMYVVNGSDGRCIVAVRLIYSRCLLFRASVKGGSTVYVSTLC